MRRLLVVLLLVGWPTLVHSASPSCWVAPISTTATYPTTTNNTGQLVSDFAPEYSITLQVLTGIITATWEGALGTSSGAQSPFKILYTFSSFGAASGTDGNGQEMVFYRSGPLMYTRLNLTASGKACDGGANVNVACTVASQCPGGSCTAASGYVWFCAAPR